jgi:transposase
MLNTSSIEKVYLACGITDLRKSIDGLAVIVKEEFELNPFSSCLFVFCNRAQDKIKILHWEHNGFWLFYRRLERGKFKWPASESMNTMNINYRELRWLLDGLSIEQKKAHMEVKARIII